MLDGREDIVVVVPRAVGCSARPVGGSGGTVWLRCCGAVYVTVGDACGWWRACSAVPFPVTSDPSGVVCCAYWLVFPGGAGSRSWGGPVRFSGCSGVPSVWAVGRWRDQRR